MGQAWGSPAGVCVLHIDASAPLFLLLRTMNQLKALLSSLPDIVYILDEKGIFLYLNEAISQLGYEPSDLVGKHFSTIIHPEDRPRISREEVVEKIRKENVLPETPPKLFDERRSGERMTRELEVRLLHRDGHIVFGLVNAYGERNIDASLFDDIDVSNPHTIGVIHDISALHLYQKALEDSVLAKERLLREMHSRIKNNLQIIASLAHLRQMEGAAGDPESMLREIQAQIRSIALVHEALYQAENVDRVSAREYMRQFAAAAMDALEIVGSRVTLEASADDVELDPDLLVPLSLAMLEMLSAVYRYSYRTKEETTVVLRLSTSNDGSLVLDIIGRGVLEPLGSETMRALLERAGARLEMDREGEFAERCRLFIAAKEGESPVT